MTKIHELQSLIFCVTAFEENTMKLYYNVMALACISVATNKDSCTSNMNLSRRAIPLYFITMFVSRDWNVIMARASLFDAQLQITRADDSLLSSAVKTDNNLRCFPFNMINLHWWDILFTHEISSLEVVGIYLIRGLHIKYHQFAC